MSLPGVGTPKALDFMYYAYLINGGIYKRRVQRRDENGVDIVIWTANQTLETWPIDSSYGTYFNTWEEAKEHLLDHSYEKLASAFKAVDKAKEYVDKVASLREDEG